MCVGGEGEGRGELLSQNPPLLPPIFSVFLCFFDFIQKKTFVLFFHVFDFLIFVFFLIVLTFVIVIFFEFFPFFWEVDF